MTAHEAFILGGMSVFGTSDVPCLPLAQFLFAVFRYDIIRVSERWPSGRRRWSRKPVWEQSHRGFESHSLRQHEFFPNRACVSCSMDVLSGHGSCVLGSERCQSGRMGATGNRVSSQGDRGFESHSLRHQFSSGLLPHAVQCLSILFFLSHLGVHSQTPPLKINAMEASLRVICFCMRDLPTRPR